MIKTFSNFEESEFLLDSESIKWSESVLGLLDNFNRSTRLSIIDNSSKFTMGCWKSQMFPTNTPIIIRNNIKWNWDEKITFRKIQNQFVKSKILNGSKFIRSIYVSNISEENTSEFNSIINRCRSLSKKIIIHDDLGCDIGRKIGIYLISFT